MTRVLLTGMSGTGKSSVIAELLRRGVTAIDLDEPGRAVRDAEGHQLWRDGKRPEKLAEVPHHLECVEPLLRRSATHEIVTTMPLERVVAAVLSLVQASGRGPV